MTHPTGLRPETPNRTPNRSSDSDLLRTDGRTNGEGAYSRGHLERAQRAGEIRNNEIDGGWFGYVLANVVDVLATIEYQPRHRITRGGDRTPIRWGTRLAIYKRDGWTCQLCRQQMPPRPGLMQLDHVTPWSAGGSDGSDNLRVLCIDCNTRRSNYRDPQAEFTRHLPVTWWCQRCWAPDVDPAEHIDCRATYCAHRPSDPAGDTPRVKRGARLAYCAHCDEIGPTDVTL